MRAGINPNEILKTNTYLNSYGDTFRKTALYGKDKAISSRDVQRMLKKS